MQELAAPLLAMQSDGDLGVTSDDNLRTPVGSPILAPAVKSPVSVILKKGKGKKGKHSPYQSRCVPISTVAYVVATRLVISLSKEGERRRASGAKMVLTRLMKMRSSISVLRMNHSPTQGLKLLTKHKINCSKSRMMKMTMMTSMSQRRARAIGDGVSSVTLSVAKSSPKRT